MLFQLILCVFQLVRTDSTLTIQNTLDFPRTEVLSIPVTELEKMLGKGIMPDQLGVKETSTGKFVLTQWVDIDQDGQAEELLFLAQLEGKETKNYELIADSNSEKKELPMQRTYARFVPERIDDITWENDKVAFRTYGPEAQRLTEEKLPGGTLTSGFDAWLKRVDYPIINKWYQKYVDGGSYHQDTGEGYDPYHVGDSRGVGGTGIWIRDSLYVSKNFTDYKILANGPLRSVFELSYAPLMAGNSTIKENKRVSIDLGSQLYKMEITMQSDKPIPNVTTGITLHEGKGLVFSDKKSGLISYWEQIDDAYLGTGILADPRLILDQMEIRKTTKDQSHMYMLLDPSQKISFYAGFAWQKAGEITSADKWNEYLLKFQNRLSNHLIITLTTD